MPSNFKAYEFIYFTIKFLSFSIYHAVICESITLPVKMWILKTQRNASEVCKYTLLNPFNISSDILRPNINQNSSQKRLKTPPCHAAQTLASTFLNYILVKVSHLFSADSTANAFSLSLGYRTGKV